MRFLRSLVSGKRTALAKRKLDLLSSPSTSSTANLITASYLEASMSSVGRRKPQVHKEPRLSTRARVAELAGETTAECTAICCCLPFCILNLAILLAVKLPRALLNRALKWKRKKLGKAKTAAITANKVSSFTLDDDDEDFFILRRGSVVRNCSHKDVVWLWKTPSPEFYEIEKEMVAKFCAVAGFGRSPSQRERE